MSGSMWQGMETRHGDGIEALSQETESNGSATPKSRRHSLTLPADGRDAPAQRVLAAISVVKSASHAQRPSAAEPNR
jgi:hypothetical protein